MEKTCVEIEGRKAMLRILRFCRKQPGLENMTIDYCAPETGIRESVTIKGIKAISSEDYKTGRLWEDSICYSFYMMGIHKDHTIDSKDIEPGVYPTVPLGAMIPEGSQGIIVAGRTVSSDQGANSALRLQAGCMAMGQAAGAASAIASKANTDFKDINIEELREVLREQGAIVPPDLNNKT